jgi:hypothetical protein
MQQESPARSGAPLYSVRGIAVGTLLGSLAAGVVMLWLNYRQLGYPGLANRVAVVALTLYAALVGATSLLPPDEPLWGVLFIALQTGIAYWAAQTLQGHAIDYHVQQGKPMHSTLRAALVGFVTGMVVIFAMLAINLLLGSVGGR